MRASLVIMVLLLAVSAAAGWYLLDQDFLPASQTAETPLSPQAAAEPVETGTAPAPEASPSAEPAAETPAAEATETPVATAETPPPGGYTSLFPEGSLDNAEATLCYFSFNRPVEFVTVRNLVSQLNAHSPIKIKVVEMISDDENIKNSIKAAVASGIRCDGVVLTGHHRGKFWGDRTSGSVKAKFIEELSCDSRYAEWFAHVKALWMEGCHTGTINPYNDEVDAKERVRGSPVGMIRANLEFDDMRGSVADMEDVIDENLAEENIANDYQRIFPYATIFGWSGYAPGEKAGSHYSFPYHIAQVSHLADPADEFFKDPMHGKLPDTAAHRYSEILYGMLKRPDFGGNQWPAALNEANFIKGWYNHGNFRMKYSLDNGALVTRKALINSDTELLRSSRAFRCVGYQGRSAMKAPGGVTAYLTNNESITPFASSLLLAMMQSGGGLGAETRAKLSRNERLKGYLRYTTQSSAEFRRNDASALLAKLGVASPQVAEDGSSQTEAKAVKQAGKEAEKKPEKPPETEAVKPSDNKLAANLPASEDSSKAQQSPALATSTAKAETASTRQGNGGASTSDEPEARAE